MAITTSQIDALQTAIASGELSVSHAGTTVQYRSITELIRARDDLQRRYDAQEAAAAGARRPRLTRLYQAGRG